MQKNKKFFQLGLTAFCVVAACIIFSVIFHNLQGFFDVISAAFRILSPIFLGVLFAYLLNPLVKLAEHFLLPRLEKKAKKPGRAAKVSRALGILFALIIGGLIVYGIFALVLPKLYETIVSLFSNLPAYYRQAEIWAQNLFSENPGLQEQANSVINSVYDSFSDFLENRLIDNVKDIMVGVTNFGISVVRSVINVLIGLVASVYMLWSKNTFQAQAKKITITVFKPKAANWILHTGREAHRIFSGFIVGKIIDSLIIGVLCYLGMLLLKLPFPVLIAVIVGVTNLIPFFGPFIGAVPSAVLILFVSPLQMLYFIIFIIVLQQLDGNVIGPRILGDSIGISGFWVLVSITVAGALFGFVGMLLGVPVFAILYVIIRDAINNSLRKKNLTTDTNAFYGVNCVEEVPGEQYDPEQLHFSENTEEETSSEPKKK